MMAHFTWKVSARTTCFYHVSIGSAVRVSCKDKTFSDRDFSVKYRFWLWYTSVTLRTQNSMERNMLVFIAGT